ncbi:MAG: YgiT-type zinc finger protein [Spirochaetota bacterium]
MFDKVLEYIKLYIREKRIYWSYHIGMKNPELAISKEAIILSTDKYEIIEQYPGDNFLPCYIVYSEYNDEKFHIIFAIDEEYDNARVIASYVPNLDTWENNLKVRRKRVKCHICGGAMVEVVTDLPYKLQHKSTVVVKEMPAYQCTNCHQFLLKLDTMQRVDGIIKQIENG